MSQATARGIATPYGLTIPPLLAAAIRTLENIILFHGRLTTYVNCLTRMPEFQILRNIDPARVVLKIHPKNLKCGIDNNLDVKSPRTGIIQLGVRGSSSCLRLIRRSSLRRPPPTI